MSKLYVAYGSNLNMMQMGWRCPTASVVGTGKIIDYKLTFRRVATIEPSVKSEVPVAVWKIEESDEKRILLQIIDGLPLREKEIIEMRFGLGEKEELTQKEVADIMGISQSYISRLEKRIIKKIGNRLKSKIK